MLQMFTQKLSTFRKVESREVQQSRYLKTLRLPDGRPSLDGAYRLTEEEAKKSLPKIPAQPIGYGDARRLLEVIGGDDAPADWQGGLPGLTYKLGPGTNKKHPGWKARIVTHNYLKDEVDDNVIGVIRGEEEPDRYVLLCNHRDAWGYGVIDPFICFFLLSYF